MTSKIYNDANSQQCDSDSSKTNFWIDGSNQLPDQNQSAIPVDVRFGLEAIPEELRSLRQWVNWRSENHKGRLSKIPYCPLRKPRARKLKRASTTNSDTWGNFEEAVSNLNWDDSLQLGFVFSEIDDFVGIDIDGCLQPDILELSTWGQEFLNKIGKTYVEVSPSGSGLKAWVRNDGSLKSSCKIDFDTSKCGRINGVEKKPGLEIYDKGRFFAVTGKVYLDCNSAIHSPTCPLSDIAAFAREYQAALSLPNRENRYSNEFYKIVMQLGANIGYKGTDKELVAEACRADEQFAELYQRGSLKNYKNDHSRADLALLRRLAYKCGPDPDRISKIYGDSALSRDKWFERLDYRERSIQKAIEGCNLKFIGGGNLDKQTNGRARIRFAKHNPIGDS